MKPVVKLAFLAVVLLVLGGCQFWGPVTISPITQIVSIYDDPGYATAAFTVAADGDVTVDFGDGAEEVYDVDSTIDLEHNYYSIGTYSVLASQGSRSDRAQVQVIVAKPIVDVPFFLESYVEEDGQIEFNIPRRYIGCDNGMALYRTGIYPGAGLTEFRMFAYDNQGNKIGLFDERGRNVWGEWITLVDDLSELQVITCWSGWTGQEPLIPMAVEKGCGSGDPGCGGSCYTGDPWIPPAIPDDAPRMAFTLQARNQYILFEDDYPRVDWRIAINRHDCSVTE